MSNETASDPRCPACRAGQALLCSRLYSCDEFYERDAEIERLRAALRLCRDVIDDLMGDSDL